MHVANEGPRKKKSRDTIIQGTKGPKDRVRGQKDKKEGQTKYVRVCDKEKNNQRKRERKRKIARWSGTL